MLAAIARANDHKDLAGPTSRNRQSFSFENFFRQGEKYFLGATVLAEKFSNLKNRRGFLQMMLGKQLANEVKMARVLYRKCGLGSTLSFLNLSGVNTLSKTVV